MITKGADVNAADMQGQTPLMWAAAKAVLPDGTTVIQAALLMKNDPFAMQVVSRGVDVNQRDSKGWQLIHTAALSGNPDLIKMVLSKGGNANALTTPPPVEQQKGVFYAAMLIQNCPAWGAQQVQVAALGSVSPKPVKTDAADVKRRPLEGFEHLLPPPGTTTPPLLLAAQSGSVEAMKVLIEAGADPKAKAADGLTLALAAARGGNLEALKFALELDPDIHALAQEGRSIMHMVVENRNSTEHEAMITYLADKGAALNVRDERLVSPGSYFNRVGPEQLRVFYIQLLKGRKIKQVLDGLEPLMVQ